MGLAAEWGIKAIAFDIDGTLYPKRQMLLRLFVSSLPCIPFALRYNAVRQQIRREDGTGGTGCSFEGFRKRECRLMYGSEEQAATSYRLAVISDFPIGVKLKALGVEGLFEYVASSEDSGALKPSRVPFDAMLSAMGLEAGEVLYVGDSESKDIRGASAAGMRSALISTSPNKVYSISDFKFSSWKEFIDKVL